MKFTHIPFILLAVVSMILATATFIEHTNGHDVAVATIYTSWWMIVLWALTAVTSLVVIVRSRVIRRPAVLLLHLSLVGILAGALVTHLSGVQGIVSLREGESVKTFTNTETRQTEPLPFQLQLASFSLQTYPGTRSPMDYVSTVDVVEHDTVAATLQISMNNIGKYQSYRFYQSGYDPDLHGTRLMINHDPWGLPITYTAYAMLFVAMFLLLVLPNERFRQLLSQKATSVLCLVLFTFSDALAAPPALPQPTAARFADLYVYWNGRVCPAQTLAHDFTVKLYGKPTYEGLSAEQVLLGFMLSPTEWTEQPIIKVKPAVARLLGIEGRYASYQDFHAATGYKLEKPLADIRSGEQTDDSRAIIEADEKMNILLMLWGGELIKIYPYRTANGIEWYSQSGSLPKSMPEDKYMFIRKSMDYIGELAWTGDYQQLESVLGKIKAYQQKEAGVLLPDDMSFRAEKLYNTTDYTRPLAMLLMTLGLLSFFIYLAHWLRGRQLPRWITVVMNTVAAATLSYLLFIIVLRGYVSGHLPLTNGFETMQFMALTSLMIMLFAQRRFLLIMPFGLLLSGLTLLVAMMGESNPQITPLMPVLSSPLLSIHVCVIMVAYSLLAFILLNALTVLILNGSRHKQAIDQLTRMSRILLYPAVFCLAAGIFIGAIWANQSWGRYWGWDPKEVWALITMLVYSIPLHAQSIAWLHRPRWFHLYMAMAFLTILMTYFGVNFLLGGMHSYA